VGEWYAILLTNRTAPLKLDINHVANGKLRGGDLGLVQFVTFDNAESVECPKFLRVAEEKINHLQRHLARKRKGSKRRRVLARQLARLHLHVARQREDWQNKLVNANAQKPSPSQSNLRLVVEPIRFEVHAQSGHDRKTRIVH
jgi:putative transposase